MKNAQVLESAASEQKSAGDITDKKGYAQRWLFSPRKIDGALSERLPHMRIGRRRVRIFTAEADAWMREKFFTQRRGPLNGGAA